MKLKILFIPFCLSIISLNTNAGVLFEDSFESGDLSTTNTEGFSWDRTNRTAIVTPTTRVYANNSTDSTPKADLSPSGDWTPKTGSHSLRFYYPASTAMSEQRFDLGTPHKEIWIRYWIRVPINFQYGPVGDPNKFIALWMDGYSSNGDGSTIWLSMWRDSGQGAKVGFTYSTGGHTGSTSFKQVKSFISTSDAGKWMQFVIHIKAESSPGASDGVIQTFRRWDGESRFTKLHNTTTAPLKIPSAGPNGFKTGYILGWANAAYTQDTEWLVDDFTVSDTPLVVTPKIATSFIVE